MTNTTQCPTCLAHYTGTHWCDPLMRHLLAEARQNEDLAMKPQVEKYVEEFTRKFTYAGNGYHLDETANADAAFDWLRTTLLKIQDEARTIGFGEGYKEGKEEARKEERKCRSCGAPTKPYCSDECFDKDCADYESDKS
jgi:hypothetical protein